MVFSYYQRLSAKRKRTYRKSDEIRLTLPAEVEAADLIKQLERALKVERRLEIQLICQALIDRLTGAFKVPNLNVVVLAVRPNNSGGELHGFYEPMEDGRLARISIWMRTVQRKQVVAFKTFLRTLIHELCHHLDYELFQLAETFHTEGFYRRESSLVYALLGQTAALKPRAENPAQRHSAIETLQSLRQK
ncbi:MAG: hypothetical protein ACREV9_14325 [Burkholderiales bacterium]